MEYHTEEYRELARKEIEILQEKIFLLEEMNIKLRNDLDITDLEAQYKSL
ncbi:hypothetical protein ACI3ER_11545 [Bacillus sp. Wb]